MPAAKEAGTAMRAPADSSETLDETNDVVRRAQNGRISALQELYLSHHQQIFRFVWSRVHDPDLAEDLTGEVFLRMLANLSQYEDRSLPFRAWLYRIARNLMIDHHRKIGSRQIMPLDDLSGEPGEEKSPEELAERNMTLVHVQQMLEQMKPDEREVVELRFLAGLSLKETALVINKTVAAVKALQRRGLVTLRSINQD